MQFHSNQGQNIQSLKKIPAGSTSLVPVHLFLFSDEMIIHNQCILKSQIQIWIGSIYPKKLYIILDCIAKRF